MKEQYMTRVMVDRRVADRLDDCGNLARLGTPTRIVVDNFTQTEWRYYENMILVIRERNNQLLRGIGGVTRDD